MAKKKSLPAKSAKPVLSPILRQALDELIEGGPDVFGQFSIELNERLAADPRWASLLEEAHREAGISVENLPDGRQSFSIDFPMPGVFYTATLKLKHSKPPVTRKLEIPDVTFGELHEIIQVAMGWTNGHLHNFRVGREWMLGPSMQDDGFGPAFAFDSPEEDDEEGCWLSELNDAERKAIVYTYDFGDNWEVEVKLSEPKPNQDGVLYPRIIDGKRPHPPDDCGGVWGYEELCDIMRKPAAELSADEQERLEWCSRFDPETVDLAEINAEYQRIYAPKPVKKKAAGKKKKA